MPNCQFLDVSLLCLTLRRAVCAWSLPGLLKNVSMVERAVSKADSLLMLRALRSTVAFRRRATSEIMIKGVEALLVDSPRQAQLVEWLGSVAKAEAVKGAADADMEPEPSAAGAGGDDGEKKGDDDAVAAKAAAEAKADAEAKVPPPSSTPEVEAYMQMLVMKMLAQHRLFEECAECASDLIRHGVAQNRRSLDWFTAKGYAFLSQSHEAKGTLGAIRGDLLAAHRTACLRHDKVGQATLLNLLLRNFLRFNLYAQATQLLGRAPFPEDASNNQYVRYLFYRGRISAVRLEYAEANADLGQALRKAPTNTAAEFRRAVQKLAVVVKLLLGELPERAIFNEPDMRGALRPYLEITQAVRIGDIVAFNAALASRGEQFTADGTYTLVLRLRHNVMKTGLRKVATSYSRISFADIAEKLHLDSPEDAEFLCAKAIHDGVIDATLDHEAKCLMSTEVEDLYSTSAPQEAFHTRIEFCLDVHNEAVKSMRYPAEPMVGEDDDSRDKLAEVDPEAMAEELAEEEEDEMDDGPL